jgi:hypothetical protein
MRCSDGDHEDVDKHYAAGRRDLDHPKAEVICGTLFMPLSVFMDYIPTRRLVARGAIQQPNSHKKAVVPHATNALANTWRAILGRALPCEHLWRKHG